MTRAAFRQADLERIFRAAKATGSFVRINLKTLEATVHPMPAEGPDPNTGFAPDGPEDWSDPEVRRREIAKENWDD